MKLISLNVGLFENNNRKLSQFLQSNPADILCLQEVTKRLDSQAKENYISKQIIDLHSQNLTSSFFAPIWILDHFCKDNFHGRDKFRFDLGGKAEFGNYVKSRFPLSFGQNVFVQNHFSYLTDWTNWPEDDCRAFQIVDLDMDNNIKLRVINYHGIWSKNKKGNQLTMRACEMILDAGLAVNYPTIICGDFNLLPKTKEIELFNENFTNLCNKFELSTTRPKDNELNNLDRNVVDYVFVSRNIRVNSLEAPDCGVSDHLPLIVDFGII